MNFEVKEQILAVRNTGRINMFNLYAVQKFAFERDFYELVCFIDEHAKEYINFIMYGGRNHD